MDEAPGRTMEGSDAELDDFRVAPLGSGDLQAIFGAMTMTLSSSAIYIYQYPYRIPIISLISLYLHVPLLCTYYFRFEDDACRDVIKWILLRECGHLGSRG